MYELLFAKMKGAQMENAGIDLFSSSGEEYAICFPPQSVIDGGKIPEVNEEACDVFLRQLTIVYSFIHYYLDRPFLSDKEWPHLLEDLQEELLTSLEADAVPAEWKRILFPSEPRTAEQRKRQELYASSLRPLFTTARDMIAAALKKIEEVEAESLQFTRSAEKNSYLKNEGVRICQWAFQKSWEVFNFLGWEKS